MTEAAAGADALIGRTIAGTYLILELVGVGGMGRVYRAEQTNLGRTVAIKVIHPHLIHDEQSTTRFYTEARAASRLNHPNSVGVIDFGRTEDGVMYLVMEFLRGRDLSRVIHEEGPLPFPRICEILLGVLAALGEAHALDIVHRDLKPENIILERNRSGADFVKVVDFGLAKLMAADTTPTNITLPGLVCGTPDYMSPEQGRGEDVDGRGDLYSVGVVLYELLTDRLPYTDDTPAKVVLRHITDPVPDPRHTAPHRGIPDVLAEICMRVMSKSADERYRSAEDFAQALRLALASLSAPRAGEMTCTACRTRNPGGMRFCGSCGTRLPIGGTIASPRPTPPQGAPHGRGETGRPVRSLLTGRANELARFESLLLRSGRGPVCAQIVGEPGVGKTSLIEEVHAFAEDGGAIVASAGPHPTSAPVPYLAVRSLVLQLLGLDLPALAQVSKSSSAPFDALARAGMAEMLEPRGLIGFENISRAGAVTWALAQSIRAASHRASNARVVVTIDELHRCDGLTHAALRLLRPMLDGVPVMIVLGSVRPLEGLPEPVETFVLRGLSQSDAARLLASQRMSSMPPNESPVPVTPHPDRVVLPLYIEQLRALGFTLTDEAAPQRLADAVAQRIERLDLSARRVLQALAVLGDESDVPTLAKLLGESALGALGGVDILERERLVARHGTTLRIAHPFVRDLVAASIPAEARKSLHSTALHIVTQEEEPLEVRAEHAYRSGEALGAIIVLERMGDASIASGAATSAVLAYRRGLDLARKELFDTGDSSLDRAVSTFSRKLGDALELTGDATGAEGVLREALDLMPLVSVDRARLLLVLGRVAARRERRRDAVRMLGQCLELAEQLSDRPTIAGAQLWLARIRREEGDHVGAANALERALLTFREAKAPEWRIAAAQIELAEVLSDLDSRAEAKAELEEASGTAFEIGAPALAALATGLLGAADELDGAIELARGAYEQAASLAESAGDAGGTERWRRASREVSRPKLAAQDTSA